jgi:hypothetical protein
MPTAVSLSAGRWPTTIDSHIDEIQHAFDVQRAGVSAQKTIVTI